MRSCSELGGNYKSMMYKCGQCNYTFTNAISDKVNEENVNDKLSNECNNGFDNHSDQEDRQRLNIPGNCLERYNAISTIENHNEMEGAKQAFTQNADDLENSKKSQISVLTSANFSAVSFKERKNCFDTNNNTHNQIRKKDNSISFRNNPKTFLNKSKHSPAAVLPPCRICGARASGLHYGVNTCEACKGFFRRALKRPVVFKCPKSKKCDVKGNKRSTCRFCRYKKCLSLGMARESIKTGRYSYKKRTRDTLEVKRLQKWPNPTSGELDLDIVTKSILTAHESLMVSHTDAPSDWIYQKQLEYHNIYLLYKRFGNHPELIPEKVGPSFGHDSSSKTSENKDCQNNSDKSGQQPSPSGSWSQLSSDSGFVDEAVTNRYTSATSNSVDFAKQEDVSKCIDHSKSHTKEQKTETVCVEVDKQYNVAAVKTSEQLSRNGQMCALSCYSCCSLCRDYFPSVDRNHLGKQFSEKDIQRADDFCRCENSQTNYPASFQGQVKRKITDLNIMQTSQDTEKFLHDNTFNNADSTSSVRSYTYSVNCKQCGKRKDVISQDVSFRKIVPTHDSNSSAEDSNTSSDATLNNRSTQGDKPGSGCFDWSFGDKDCDDPHDNIRKHAAAAKPSPPVNNGTNACGWSRVGRWSSSLSVRGESEAEIVQRATTWIQGYVEFAKEIPGFSSLPFQDQSALLKSAWDEVWLLGTFRGYNKTLGVAMTPRGTCVHADEMEAAWGRHYARFAFIMAGIIKRYSLSRQLLILLKAVCIVAPDRCPLSEAEKVSDIHWMVVSCLQRHAEKTQPGNRQIFPRLVSILTSLRELSESARRDVGARSLMCDYNILSQTLMPF
ncbi:unnamed protein product [Candidula unifasciata]|uniref:Uncharacterized protein n=1 Tax=Candidula unifasciata TaxID=100452 RepID=A0A8S3ZQU1_9EUPU|nr:unnamed protein product [Candidula unifasciata]